MLTLFLPSLDVQLCVYGPQPPEVVVMETTLAHTISGEGRYVEADKIQGLKIRRYLVPWGATPPPGTSLAVPGPLHAYVEMVLHPQYG